MNLLSPGDIFLAVRRRSLCTPPPNIKANDDLAEAKQLQPGAGDHGVGGLSSKKTKQRRNSLSEASPATRRPSFFQRLPWEGS